MAASFELEFRVVGARLGTGTSLLSVSGELDPHTLPRLRTALAGADGDSPLIVDLTDVTFLDSTALGTLVAEARRRTQDSRALTLVCDNRVTLRTLEVTGFLPLFAIEESLREAVERDHWRGGAP